MLRDKRRRIRGGSTRWRASILAAAAAALVLAGVGIIGATAISASAANSTQQAATGDAQTITAGLRSGAAPTAAQGSPWIITSKDGSVVTTSLSLQNFRKKDLRRAAYWNPPKATANAPLLTYGYFYTLDAVPGNPLANTNFQTLDSYVAVANPEARQLGAPAGTEVHLQVLVSPLGQQQAVSSWRNSILFLGAVAVVLVGVAVWFGVSASLRPVDRLRKRLLEQTQENEYSPLPVPRTNDEIERLGDTFNTTLAQLEEQDARRKEFVSDAAHELRSPVAALVATLEIASLYPDSTSSEDAIATALRQSRRLHALTEDLLLLTRLEGPASATATTLQEVDVSNELSLAAAASGPLTPRLSITPGRTVTTGNSSDVRRLFDNLLSNAQRHARSKIEVDLSHTGQTITASLYNDGPRIPEKDLERVFERLVRLDDARASADGGSGLGLAIARQIAVNHGGVLNATNEMAGVVFTVTFPTGPRES